MGDETLLDRVFRFSILGDDVRPQDAYFCFVSASKTALGRRFAWKFLTENWDVYSDVFADGQFLFPRIISYAAKFHSFDMADEVAAFFGENPVSFHRTLDQILESIRADALWLDLQRDDFSSFLLQQK